MQMSTEKQLIANQQNAQLSTGPMTSDGKTVVAMNAIKHGIFAKDLILVSELENENANDYQELLYTHLTHRGQYWTEPKLRG